MHRSIRRVIDLDRINRQWIYHGLPAGCDENHRDFLWQKQKRKGEINVSTYTNAVHCTRNNII